MADTAKQQRMEFLYQLLAGIQTPEDMAALLEDLCTRKEVENMAERVFAARLLLENNTYAQVMEQCSISSATLSRVSRCVQYGTGYRRAITRE